MNRIMVMGENAKRASLVLSTLSTQVKNEALSNMAKALMNMKDETIKANEQDLDNARKKGISDALIERLMLNDARIQSMIQEST